MHRRWHLDHQNPIGPHVDFFEHPKSTGSSFSILKYIKMPIYSVWVYPIFRYLQVSPWSVRFVEFSHWIFQPVGESIDFKKIQNLMIPQWKSALYQYQYIYIDVYSSFPYIDSKKTPQIGGVQRSVGTRKWLSGSPEGSQVGIARGTAE